MMRKRLLRAAAMTAATGAMAAGAVAGTMGSAAAAEGDPSAQATNGCPNGAVCLYNPAGWDAGTPEHVYWSYGVHQLYDEYGTHHVFNNQHSGASMELCGTREPAQCGAPWVPGVVVTQDLTPVNSIRLAA